jgi:hypothetical protein
LVFLNALETVFLCGVGMREEPTSVWSRFDLIFGIKSGKTVNLKSAHKNPVSYFLMDVPLSDGWKLFRKFKNVLVYFWIDVSKFCSIALDF